MMSAGRSFAIVSAKEKLIFHEYGETLYPKSVGAQACLLPIQVV